MSAKLTFVQVFFVLFSQAFALPGFPGPRPGHPTFPCFGKLCGGPPEPAKKWTAVGCFTDQAAPNRALTGRSYVDLEGMTVESCVAFCKKDGYNYAGVEYGHECYCDYAIQHTGVPVSKAQCNMPCSGNNKQTCSAGDRLSVFYSGSKEPETPERVKTWKYTGCYADSVQDRALERVLSIPAGVTAQTCTSACKGAGFKFAGLEFGGECFCGNDLDSTKVNDNQCKTACVADTNQLCGGPDRLAVFVDTSVPKDKPKGSFKPKFPSHHH